MPQKQELSEQESLRIISEMILKARNEFYETGVSALLWGSIITFCSMYSFASFYYPLPLTNYVWFLPLFAIIPQIIISINESKNRKFKTHADAAMGGIWISFGIAILLVSLLYSSKFDIPSISTLFLILYGIPTFTTGFARSFMPMIIGGIICWILAIISMYVSFPASFLLTAIAAIVAWLIPGFILRRTYLTSKTKHV